LSKLQQPKSKLGQLKQLHSNLGRVRNISKLGTYRATVRPYGHMRPSIMKFAAVHM